MEYSIAQTESFLRSFLIKAEYLPDEREAFVRWLELNSVTEQSVCSEGEAFVRRLELISVTEQSV